MNLTTETHKLILKLKQNNIPVNVLYNESNLHCLIVKTKNSKYLIDLLENVDAIYNIKKSRSGYLVFLSEASISENVTLEIALNNGIEFIDFDLQDRLNIQETQIKNTAHLNDNNNSLKRNTYQKLPISKRKQKKKKFDDALKESLDGLATPSNEQPKDLFNKFANALDVLGQQITGAPLQQQLKQQGINWKTSADGQNIILYIVNAETNRPQAIATVNYQQLINKSEFSKQLTTIIDLARGKAPGTHEQAKQQLNDQDKVIRDVADAISPEEKNDPSAELIQQKLTSQTAANPK